MDAGAFPSEGCSKQARLSGQRNKRATDHTESRKPLGNGKLLESSELNQVLNRLSLETVPSSFPDKRQVGYAETD